MQVKRGPTIPKKPHYLSATDHELEKDGANHGDDTLANTTQLPRQQDVTSPATKTTAALHNKQTYQMGGQNSNAKKPTYRRPRAALSIQHLTLYSSSSPDNLLAPGDHNKPTTATSSNVGRQRASSSIQHQQHQQHNTKGPTEEPPMKPRRPSAPQVQSSGSYTKPGHQWDFDLFEQQQQEQRASAKDNAKTNGARPGVSQTHPVPLNGRVPPASVNTNGIQSRKGDDIRTSKYDALIAQLVEMGFNATEAENAIESSNDHSIQGALDLLVRNNSGQQQHDIQQQRTRFEPSTTTKPPPPPPTTTSTPWRPTSSSGAPSQSQEDNWSSDEDDDALLDDQKWQQQQEARRRDYLESLKKQQHQQQQQQQQETRPKYDNTSKSSSFTKPMPTEPVSAPKPPPPTSNVNTTSRPASSSSSPSYSTPSSSRPSSTLASKPPISPDMIKKAIKARTRGNDLFKLGYYSEAEKSYNQALAILPDKHDITAVISNNRAAARLKNGQYKPCITDCTFVIAWARQKGPLLQDKASITVLDGDITIRWHDQLGKALHRKAESLERLLRLTEAQQVYDELVRMDAADTKARNGLARCQPPPPTAPPPPPRRPASTTTATKTAFPGLDYSIFETTPAGPPPSKAVAAMRARQAELAKEDAERLEKVDVVNARIDGWKRGKEKNIRALLSSLDTLLWPGAQWRGFSIHELLEPKKVKICYMKAISKVHPDKLPSSTTVEQRLLASGIFSVLNQAWDDFRTSNRL